MYPFVKRTFDIMFSGIMLVLLSPVMLAIAIMVKIKLGGPVIFVHYRPGKDGKIFPLYKFRSMINAWDKNGFLLPDEKRDTKFGKMLRSTSLDELPQLVNIFLGHMSLIGPRPRQIKDAVFYGIQGNEVYSLSVRPGLSGRSQVYGRNNNSWESVFAHDEYYVKHMGLWQDIKIFFMTFVVVLKRTAATYEKDEFKFYCDYVKAKGLITDKEYNDCLQLQKTMEKNCELGIVQYVRTYKPIAVTKRVSKVRQAVVVDDEIVIKAKNC